jgi:YidC/Oxa1 family membrane protein insertase
MGNLRPVLFLGLAFLAYMMWVEWQKDYAPRVIPPVNQSSTAQSDIDLPPMADQAGDLPELGETPTGTRTDEPDLPALEAPAQRIDERSVIRVITDVLEVDIDLIGGSVVSARLLNYPVVLEEPDIKVQLLIGQGENMFIAQSGLLSHQPGPNHTSQYTSSQKVHTLADGEQELRVPLTWDSDEGISVTKTFVFQRSRYDIAVSHRLQNNSAQAWSGSRFYQLQKSVPAH